MLRLVVLKHGVQMEKKLSNSIDDLVDYIINTKEYKDCIKYKKEMENDKDIIDKVNNIKRLLKEYVRSNDSSIKEKLDLLENELNDIDLYIKYNQNLEVVNQMINYVKEELNDYFYNLLNENANYSQYFF